MAGSLTALDKILDGLADAHPGPGGAVAVLRDGAVLAKGAWGWADVEQRIPFTPNTLFRVCSITKQFTVAATLNRFPDLAMLDADVQAMMPKLAQAPAAAHLAHNQSGLRDYWATAMLCGATVERPFGDAEAADLIGRTASLHFIPGAHYSYCNQNFRILGDIAARRTGRSLNELMAEAAFAPAGMATARLVPNTETMPDGTIGYEGSVETGFRAAVNRILWTGDAGLAASLEDMIAWETFIDATRDDPHAIYSRLSKPVAFTDGTAAGYGFGLARFTLCDRPATGHGGGLRGWRSFRCNIPSERVSIIVLFNHMGEPRAATQAIAEALLNHPPAAKPIPAEPAWTGNYEEPATGLALRLETTPDHHVRLTYSGRHPEQLTPGPDGAATAGTTRLERTETGIRMTRGTDNQTSILSALGDESRRDIAGTFHNAEYDAAITVIASGQALYAAFSGFLGRGMMQILLPAGPDMWRMPMPRALDDSPPGDWTIKVLRDSQGKPTRLQIGCWLARGLVFARA